MPRFKVCGRSKVLWSVECEALDAEAAYAAAREYVADMLQLDGIGGFAAEVDAQEDIVVSVEEVKQ